MDARIVAGLATIRRRRLQLWLIWAAYIPVVVSTVFGLKALGVDDERFFTFAGVAYLALFAAAGIRVGLARCPSCGNRYHSRTLRHTRLIRPHNPWTRKCLNCGLPLHLGA